MRIDRLPISLSLSLFDTHRVALAATPDTFKPRCPQILPKAILQRQQ